MTPIKPGTAKRIGLRKPEPVLWHVMDPDVTAVHASLRALGEFMAENDRKVQQAFAVLRENLRQQRL